MSGLRQHGRENGFALVAVLVVLAVAALLAGAALTLADTSVTSAQGYAAEIEGGHAAEASVRLTAIRLADSEGYTLGDLSPGRSAWRGWAIDIGIEDEAAKFDLNRTPRPALVAALRQAGVSSDIVDSAAAASGRFVSTDSLAGRRAPAGTLAAIRRRFTVYGGAEPQQGGQRSALATYRIVARATRDRRVVTRWAIVRLSPGFGEPFEWLERGSASGIAEVSR